ncbi:hypothetical protein RIVERRIDER_94 [Xanthomonas phage RiverRider]|uniref:Thoeris anti-defense 2-like domain-containing protein n=1 Tax=Xanthomonas phage RiverRider TaxID=2108116 RepID=A0A2P1JUZ8_9CAUD|nr:hypothetical protein HWB58_gp41 [Xanthomonas phage RiverRider]AVO23175.1 hypothetical protein RIVERRIDER_94 [Xanthomonas phage RiverRider]
MEQDIAINKTAVKEGTFEWALSKLKSGLALSRQTWNGPDQFVYLVPPNQYKAQTGIAKTVFGQDSLVPYAGYFAIKTTIGVVSVWVPSTGDLLAADWFVKQI